MDQPQQSLIAERGAQMFPTLSELELARLKRFGTSMHFPAGAAMQTAGQAGPGLMLILSGEAEVTQRLPGKAPLHIVTHKAGSFMGELAQLSGRPVLVDAVALTDVAAVAIAPDRLRALIIAEAVLGERIMRAGLVRQ